MYGILNTGAVGPLPLSKVHMQTSLLGYQHVATHDNRK